MALHDPDCPWLDEQFARWQRDHPDQDPFE